MLTCFHLLVQIKGNTHLFSCIPWAYTHVLKLALSLYCKYYQLFRLEYAYKSLTVFAFLIHIQQNTAREEKKEQNFLYGAIPQYIGADYLTVIEMKVQVKEILTHTPPCTSFPIIARSFKTGFSCAGLSSLFTLSLNWTADIPQTVANTAKSVALRDKKQMHFCNSLTSWCVMAILEGQRFHAETKCANYSTKPGFKNQGCLLFTWWILWWPHL